MKSNSLITGLSLMLASVVVLYACQKDLSPSRPSPTISASTTSAAVGEQVTLSVNNAPLGTHLMWASTSSANAAFRSNDAASANVSFTKPGTYQVTCYFVSGDAADTMPNFDTSHYPNDTIINYPPVDTTNYPPVDSTHYPHDSVPDYPHDTVPNYPHDTVPNYPNDTTPNYPHDTLPNYPHDTLPNYPHDSTYIDSVAHANHAHIIGSVTITIIVH